ncbi:MAG: hypothetical protein EA353_12820 [Puniceicoccaceae bacterium]|nr:MAG: hypothetical protein EA353_12820 [Puniceicoccaceae bacterium]
MSCIFCIGILASEALSDQAENLQAIGFSSSHLDEVGSEACACAIDFLPTGLWAVAVNREGESDLDFVYRIPDELANGRLRDLVEILKSTKGIKRIDVLVYDLGTSELKDHAPEPWSKFSEVLLSYYSLGGPICSMHHSFEFDI